MKKRYESPVLATEKVILGVFGSYNNWSFPWFFKLFGRRRGF